MSLNRKQFILTSSGSFIAALPLVSRIPAVVNSFEDQTQLRSVNSLEKLSLDQFGFPAYPGSGINERNTVSNGPDDGTLNLNARFFWNCKRHGTTSQAVDNFLIATALDLGKSDSDFISSLGGFNLCGHGNEGLVETGAGQT